MNFLQLSKLRMVSLRATEYYVTLFRVLIDHNPTVSKEREENNSILLQRYEISLTSLYLNHIISCFNLRCSYQFFVLSPTLNTARYHSWFSPYSYAAYQLVYSKSRRISWSLKTWTNLLGTKSVIYLVINERAAVGRVTYYIAEDVARLQKVVFVWE
jgi:hypothetical protein